jgi:ligand-binding SRPBCC domain-containing protein
MIRLETIMRIRAPIGRSFDLARSVEVHVLGNIHYGEAAVAESGVTSGLLGLNQPVTWRARHFFVQQKLTSRITSLDRPNHFRDEMIRGAFRSMVHDHYFRALSADITEMRDVFQFSAPLGVLGRIAEVLVLRRYMHKLLRERNDAIRNVAESEEWRRYLPEAV